MNGTSTESMRAPVVSSRSGLRPCTRKPSSCCTSSLLVPGHDVDEVAALGLGGRHVHGVADHPLGEVPVAAVASASART